MNNTVLSIAIDSNDNVYVGGQFTTAGGVSANRIAKWNGTAWSALGTGLDNFAQVVAIDSNNNVYVGGGFTTAGGVFVLYLEKWNTTSSAWDTLGFGHNLTVTGIGFDSFGNLYTTGYYTNAIAQQFNKFVKFRNNTLSETP